jgi:hypothetical protein
MRGYVEFWAEAAPELIPLTQQRTTIGRGNASDIRLGDTTVSDPHAVIESYGSSFALRDLGSLNGTFVNGERLVTERRLRGGDEIRSARPASSSAAKAPTTVPARTHRTVPPTSPGGSGTSCSRCAGP